MENNSKYKKFGITELMDLRFNWRNNENNKTKGSRTKRNC